MAPANPDALHPHATRVIGGSTAAVGVSALGIVFGDIGTSPRSYTLKPVGHRAAEPSSTTPATAIVIDARRP